jgi:hypothetical protein
MSERTIWFNFVSTKTANFYSLTISNVMKQTQIVSQFDYLWSYEVNPNYESMDYQF